MQLPAAPPDLPPEPAAFYAELRARLEPLELDVGEAEDGTLHFGDGGVGLTLPHVTDPDWVVAAQVSRRHALVFVGPAAHAFDDAGDPPAIAGLVVRALRGEVAVALRYRGDALVEVEAFDGRRSLGARRVGGPGSWARWRPVHERRRTVDYRRAGRDPEPV